MILVNPREVFLKSTLKTAERDTPSFPKSSRETSERPAPFPLYVWNKLLQGLEQRIFPRMFAPTFKLEAREAPSAKGDRKIAGQAEKKQIKELNKVLQEPRLPSPNPFPVDWSDKKRVVPRILVDEGQKTIEDYSSVNLSEFNGVNFRNVPPIYIESGNIYSFQKGTHRITFSHQTFEGNFPSGFTDSPPTGKISVIFDNEEIMASNVYDGYQPVVYIYAKDSDGIKDDLLLAAIGKDPRNEAYPPLFLIDFAPSGQGSGQMEWQLTTKSGMPKLRLSWKPPQELFEQLKSQGTIEREARLSSAIPEISYGEPVWRLTPISGWDVYTVNAQTGQIISEEPWAVE